MILRILSNIGTEISTSSTKNFLYNITAINDNINNDNSNYREHTINSVLRFWNQLNKQE